MNTINLHHACWSDLAFEIRSISPDYDSILRRARELVRLNRQGPARTFVLRRIGLVRTSAGLS